MYLNSHSLHYVKDFPTLSNKIDDMLQGESSQEHILDSIRACHNLQQTIHNYDKFWEDPTNIKINDKIVEVLLMESVNFTDDLLKQIFLLQLPTITTLAVIEAFYKKNPESFIPKETALIPLRFCLYNGDLQNALKLTDLTTGHKNYIEAKSKELRKGTIQLLGSTVGAGLFANLGVKLGLESGYIPSAWANMTSVYAMVAAYIVNSSFFAAVVKFGRVAVAGGGDYLTWQKGTFYTHWWKHSDEMLFCTKIMETDIALNGTGSASEGLIEELCRTDETLTNGRTLQPGYTRNGKKVRLLATRDNLNELMLQAYWMTGGDGFEWVEPDQDPADIMWKQHLAQFDTPLVGDDATTKSLKWADDLIESDKQDKMIGDNL